MTFEAMILRNLLEGICATQPLDQLCYAIERARRYLHETPVLGPEVADVFIQRWHSSDAQDEVHFFRGQTYLLGINPAFFHESWALRMARTQLETAHMLARLPHEEPDR